MCVLLLHISISARDALYTHFPARLPIPRLHAQSSRAFLFLSLSHYYNTRFFLFERKFACVCVCSFNSTPLIFHLLTTHYSKRLLLLLLLEALESSLLPAAVSFFCSRTHIHLVSFARVLCVKFYLIYYWKHVLWKKQIVIFFSAKLKRKWDFSCSFNVRTRKGTNWRYTKNRRKFFFGF